jgi:deoxyribonucleoside regulator
MTRQTAASSSRLAYAAYLYYVHDLDQSEIARRLGVSRSNVSRMLTSARELGIVRFHVVYEPTREHDLEEALVARFGSGRLEEALVVRPPAEDDRAEHASEVGLAPSTLALSEAVVEWLSTHLAPGQRLGLSWGGTLQAIVDAAHFDHPIDVHVVQVAGELSLDPRHSAHDLVRDLATKLGGHCTYFNAPAVLGSAEDLSRFRRSPQVAEALELARGVDVALLGIGAFGVGTSGLFLDHSRATPEELSEATARGVVGQMAGRFFDADGHQADLALHQRVLSVELDDLAKVPTVVAAATTAAKARAVSAALRGGLVSVLACDAALAEAVLAEASPGTGRARSGR